MAENDFRPPIAQPPERIPANIHQVDNRDVAMDWGIRGRFIPQLDKSAIKLLPIGAKRGKA